MEMDEMEYSIYNGQSNFRNINTFLRWQQFNTIENKERRKTNKWLQNEPIYGLCEASVQHTVNSYLQDSPDIFVDAFSNERKNFLTWHCTSHHDMLV